jgi:hypothetical protein
VHIGQPIGWNPPTRLQPKVNRKKATNGILLKHKLFLKELEIKKQIEREELKQKLLEEEQRVNLIREQA